MPPTEGTEGTRKIRNRILQKISGFEHIVKESSDVYKQGVMSMGVYEKVTKYRNITICGRSNKTHILVNLCSGCDSMGVHYSLQ